MSIWGILACVGSRRTVGLAVLIVAVAFGAAISVSTAYAQSETPDTAQAERLEFDIPAQPLAEALIQFGRQAGLQASAETGVVETLRSSPVKGQMTWQQALTTLLSGTGLTYRRTGSLVTLERPGGNDESSVQLGPITVEGAADSPYGPDDGFVAGRSVAGTKTNTPIIETPQSISIVTRDQMDARAVQNIGEAVQYTAGVRSNLQSESSGLAGSNIVVRGFGGDGTAGTSGNEYIDGLRIRGTNFVSAGFEPYLFERVEVLKGPSSVLYGQSTPAGIVNHVSKRPTDESFYEIQGEIGSFSRREGAVDFGGPLDEGRQFLYRVTGLLLDTEAQTEFTGRDRKVIAPSFTWQPSNDTSLTILTTYQNDDFEGGFVNRVPAFGTIFDNPNGEIADDFFQGDPNFNSWDRELFSVGYQFEHRFDETWAVRQNARYVHNDLALQSIFGTVQADLRTLNRTSFSADEVSDDITIDNQLEAAFETGPVGHTVLFGFDYQTLDRDTSRSIGSVAPLDLFNPVYNVAIPPLTPFQDIGIQDEQIGVYAQDQIKFDNWILTLGGRYDWADSETENKRADTKTKQSDQEFSGRAGLGYLFENGLAPYISYSESFQPVSGVDFSGSPFDPTTGTQYEAGIKYQPNDFNALVTLAAFQVTQQNVQTPDPVNTGFSVQTGEVRSRGIELEGVASFDNGLSLAAAFTLQDVEVTKANDGTKGNAPAGTAKYWASIWGDYTVQDGPLQGLGAGVGIRHIGESAGDDQSTFTVPDYTLVDAAIHYDLGAIVPALSGSQIAINASNLLDKDYVASCARIDRCFQGVGRNVIATLRLRW